MTLGQACPPEYQRAQYAFKDSMTHKNSAIRITYRISLRSSSMPEPRDPLLKVLQIFCIYTQSRLKKGLIMATGRHRPEAVTPPAARFQGGPAKATR
jgi:hypothetical protein